MSASSVCSSSPKPDACRGEPWRCSPPHRSLPSRSAPSPWRRMASVPASGSATRSHGLSPAALAVFLARRGWLGSPGSRHAALIVIALSFIGPAQEGVHRWLGLGPIQLNAAALVLPPAIAAFSRERAWLAIALLRHDRWPAGVAARHLPARRLRHRRDRAGRSTASAGAERSCRSSLPQPLIAVCLSRPDPLAPVRARRGHLHPGLDQSPLLAIAMARRSRD